MSPTAHSTRQDPTRHGHGHRWQSPPHRLSSKCGFATLLDPHGGRPASAGLGAHSSKCGFATLLDPHGERPASAGLGALRRRHQCTGKRVAEPRDRRIPRPCDRARAQAAIAAQAGKSAGACQPSAGLAVGWNLRSPSTGRRLCSLWSGGSLRGSGPRCGAQDAPHVHLTRRWIRLK